MRSALLASLPLLLAPVLPALAADKVTEKTTEKTTVKTTEKAPEPAAARDSSATANVAGDGTAAVSGAKGVTLGVHDLPTIGGFFYFSQADSLRLNLGLGFTFKPAFGAQFGIEANVRHHLIGGNLRPYLEGGIRFGYAGNINFALQGGFGVEYFIVPRVSVAGTLGLALRFDDGGSSISLPFGTTALLVNFHL